MQDLRPPPPMPLPPGPLDSSHTVTRILFGVFVALQVVMFGVAVAGGLAALGVG